MALTLPLPSLQLYTSFSAALEQPGELTSSWYLQTWGQSGLKAEQVPTLVGLDIARSALFP
jgi:hypothetical protein